MASLDLARHWSPHGLGRHGVEKVPQRSQDLIQSIRTADALTRCGVVIDLNGENGHVVRMTPGKPSIVSLFPAATEMVCGLGLDCAVGRRESCLPLAEFGEPVAAGDEQPR